MWKLTRREENTFSLSLKLEDSDTNIYEYIVNLRRKISFFFFAHLKLQTLYKRTNKLNLKLHNTTFDIPIYIAFIK